MEIKEQRIRPKVVHYQPDIQTFPQVYGQFWELSNLSWCLLRTVRVNGTVLLARPAWKLGTAIAVAIAAAVPSPASLPLPLPPILLSRIDCLLLLLLLVQSTVNITHHSPTHSLTHSLSLTKTTLKMPTDHLMCSPRFYGEAEDDW